MVSVSSDRTAARAATPTGPEANFWTIAASSLRSAESSPSSSISIMRMADLRGRFVDPAVAVDLGVVADPLEQPVDDPGRAPSAPGDRLASRPRRSVTPRISAERRTIDASSSSV